MADPAPRLSRRGKIFRTIALSVIVLAVATVLVAGYVYYEAIQTFEVRRVSLPTRVYTDAYPLTAGREVSSEAVLERLERLGYRQVDSISTSGEFARAEGNLSIFLRGFRYPGGTREAMPVIVSFDGKRIDAVSSNGAPVQNAALEPELLTSIFSDTLENRRPVTLDQVPQHLVDAVVVTEDVRFWQHPGVDPIGIFRALFRNVRAGGVAEGGSTLTQQLVKNYYLSGERTIRRKLVEAFMSVILDAKYSKQEILEAYLNDIYLGRSRSISILGVGEAARYYFGKPVSEIDVAEAAMIAGMIRSPNNYSPFDDAERAKARRATVLGLMLRNEKITTEQHAEALDKPLPKKPTRLRTGLASIPYYVDRVLAEMANDYGIKDVKGRGLSVYTAIDLEWQDSAARELESGLARLEKSSRRLRRSENPLQGAIIAVDVATGEIRALVGGRDYQRSQFNRATNARRQVGSLFKPFVFLAAFEPSLSNQNITPATLVNDTRFVVERRFSRDWSPRNYGEQYLGVVTVRKSLEQSLNAASVRIGLAAGLDAVIRTAQVLGIRSELEQVPSLILGSVALPPVEMAEAYTTIARVGSRVPLRAVRFVTDDDGDVVAGGQEVKAVQVFPARSVYLMLDVMKGVMNRGTGAGARGQGFRKVAAGKTGTTNDKRDAWFIGFTPKTLAVTWVGFDDNAPVGFSGSEGAVPLWARYMRDITANQEDADFGVPGGIVFAQIDVMSGGLATPACPRNDVAAQAFKSGTEPAGLCSLHGIIQQPPMTVDPYPPDLYGTDPFATGPGFDPGTAGTEVPTLTGGSFPTDRGVVPAPVTTPRPMPTLSQPPPGAPAQRPTPTPTPEEAPEPEGELDFG
jgi:penicillin-binding protein 1B